MRETSQQNNYAQGWWLLTCITLLAVYIAHDQRYLDAMIDADRSYISLVIIIAFIAASAHAAWHIHAISARIDVTKNLLKGGEIQQAIEPVEQVGFEAAEQFANQYLEALLEHKEGDNKETVARETALVLDVYADQLRNPSETGWYLVDILIRLGLIGTIIGFIIVLNALNDGPPPTGDNIQSLLIAMSGGMGTALYTTLAGLICASILGAQHMILSRAIEYLISLLIDLKSKVVKGEALS